MGAGKLGAIRAVAPSPRAQPSPRPPRLSSCPRGFTEYPGLAKCYAWLNISVPFANATAACASLAPNASVAIIKTAAEQAAINKTCVGKCYIGVQRVYPNKCTADLPATCGTDRTCACGFKWIDGSKMNFSQWAVQRPKYPGSSCVYHVSEQGWQDGLCTENLSTVCQGKASFILANAPGFTSVI